MKTVVRFLLPCLISLTTGITFADETAKSDDAAKAIGHHIMLQPAELQWTEAKALPAGGQVAVLEGDPSKPGPFTMRFKAPAGYKVPPHWHPADEHLTVITGRISMGMGEQIDETKTHELAPGGFSIMPAGVRHFVSVKEDAVIQVHGIGPWGINYVNASDDPRGK